jgi:hypothetical protein
VNVTELPAHIVVAEPLMLTDGVMVGLTVIVIVLLIAGLGEGQVTVDVISTVTLSALFRVDEV